MSKIIYRPTHRLTGEMWDTWLYWHEGTYHLYYLARTGRVGRAAAWAGSLLNVKPVLEHNAEAGETMPFARPRSKAKAPIRARLEQVGRDADVCQ